MQRPVLEELRKHLHKDPVTNRKDGFNTGILSAMSMVRGEFETVMVVQALKSKKHRGSMGNKMKPLLAGYNEGLEKAIEIIEAEGRD